MILDEPPMVTRSLLLRPLVLDDVGVAYALSNEAPARKWLSSQICRDAAHALSVVQILIRLHRTSLGENQLAVGHGALDGWTKR